MGHAKRVGRLGLGGQRFAALWVSVHPLDAPDSIYIYIYIYIYMSPIAAIPTQGLDA